MEISHNIDIHDADDDKVNDMLDYCMENKLSLISFTNTSVNNDSGDCNNTVCFRFTNEHDALIFKLKYI